MVGDGQVMKFAQCCVRLDSERVFHHATFIFFDRQNLFGLLLNRHTLVDNTNTTFGGNGNCQAGFRHGVHRR